MAITRKNFVRQYEHVAVVAHGAHPEYRLEHTAPIAETETYAAQMFQGAIVSLNNDGEFVLGCGAGTGVNYPVPCIAFKNIQDPDVTTGVAGKSKRVDGGVVTEIDDYDKSTYSSVGGQLTVIPCTGSYEIESTEFDIEGTYKPNDALIPSGVSADGAGIIKKATKQPYTTASEPIIGFVSRPPYAVANGAYGNQVRIAFWTNFIPVPHA